MGDDLVTSLQFHTTCYLAPLGCIGVFLCVKQREEVHLPSYPASLFNNIFHIVKFDSAVLLGTVDLELILSFEFFGTLRAGHLERGFKLDVFITVHFHLLCVVLTVLFLSDLMFGCLSMPLEELLAHETLNAGTALESTLAVTESVIGAKRAATLGIFKVLSCSRTTGRFFLLLQGRFGCLHDSVDFTHAVTTIFTFRCLILTAFGTLFFFLFLFFLSLLGLLSLSFAL